MRILKKPEERRNEILDAAELLFGTKGYARTTVNDILQETGIAKGTLYYYYQSKEEIMNALVERFISHGLAAAQAIAANPDLHPYEKIRRIISAQNQDIPRKEPIIEQLHRINNAEMHQKSLVETVLKLTPVLTEVVEEGIRKGVFHTSTPKEVVEFLLVSSQFLFDKGIFQWEPQEIRTKAQAFSQIIETTLGAERGSFSFVSNMLDHQSDH